MEISNANEDEKRETEPIKQVLALGGPYPMVVLPVDGEYWMEGTYHVLTRDTSNRPVFPDIDLGRCQIADDSAAYEYRRCFLGKDHLNFAGVDNRLGPVLLSVLYEDSVRQDTPGTGAQYRVVLRLKDRSVNRVVPVASLRTDCPGPRDFIRVVLGEECEVDRFHPVAVPRASEEILKFDEHSVANSYKFGVVYQKFGQTSDEEYFQNQHGSPALDEFLDMLGEKVELQHFPKYRGGLDVKFGQTGQHSYYTEHQNKEIMFHVSTLLPYTPKDQQQLPRKRHIGNDVVTVIFQDENTPFCPTSIRSHFLHVFVVVQVDKTSGAEERRYKVSVTAKEGVPKFSPALPNPSVFRKGPELRELLLSKMINAEMAAMKSDKFTQLAERTRSMLLQGLVNDFMVKNEKLLDDENLIAAPPEPKGGGILSSFRSALNRNARAGSTVLSSSSSSSQSSSQSQRSGSLGHHSLSLNDLQNVDTDVTKKEAKKTKSKKHKKESIKSPVNSSAQIIRHSSSPACGQRPVSFIGNVPRQESIPDSPPSRHSVHGDQELAIGKGDQPGQTKSRPRFYTNYLFDKPGSPMRPVENEQALAKFLSDSDPVAPTTPPLPNGDMGSEKESRKDVPSSGSPSRSSRSNRVSIREEPVVAGYGSALDLAAQEIERLKIEVNKLKIDKMDLVRQNVVQQREIKLLKDKMMNAAVDMYTSQMQTLQQVKRIHKGAVPTTHTEFV